MAFERLERNTTKNVLWIYVLSLLKEKKMYAYEMNTEIEKRYGFKPARITSYVVLYRLLKAGYVRSEIVRKRRYYEITTSGIKLLEKGITYLKNLVSRLE